MIKACKGLKMSPTQKAVLLAVAWYASDDGDFWGSVATIVDHTCLSERAVRKTLHDLVESGALTAEVRNGTSTKYIVSPLHYVHPCTPCTPAHCAPDPCTPCTPTPAPDAPPPAPGAPNKLIKEKKTKAKQNTGKFDPLLACPEVVQPELWQQWVQHRVQIKKPLTEASCREQARLLAASPDPVGMIRRSIAAGWQGLFENKTTAPATTGPRANLSGMDYSGANDGKL